ncbi:MAG TPA: hypothetical protein DCS93_04895 [Microscillaceae bacterium]|nr:hypothetical protein [Microscillaceae bacterium]
MRASSTFVYRFLLIFWSLALYYPTVGQKNQGKKTQSTKPFIVVIDPGHGGKDPGRERGSKKMKHEKHLNLAVSKKLGAYLKKHLPNTKVYYTRTKDTYPTYEERVALAAETNADVFLSIHCNSVENTKVRGTELHIHSFDLPASRLLAKLISKEFRTRAGRKSRGIFDAVKRQRNLFVLQHAKVPSVLVECGYMTNPKEEEYLNSDYGQSIIASAIFRALRTYKNSNPPKENRDRVYRVQLMATQKPISPQSKRFDKLPKEVKRLPNKSSKKYKYRYVTGWEYTLKEARQLLTQVQDLGFKDAFLISTKDSE